MPAPKLRPQRPSPANPRPGRLPAAWVLLVAGVAACGPATGGDPEFWSPVPGHSTAGDLGGQGGAGGSEGGGGAVTTTSTTTSNTTTSSTTTTTTMQAPPDPQLTVQFKTVTFFGHYAPRNVGAVWIENGNNQFVKTLEVWAAKRSQYLVKWKAASGGNKVDAVTSATKNSHVSHTDHWDGTDVNGNVVPDGPYHVYIEFTEYDGAGKWTQIDFDKGPTPVDISPPDEQYFIQKHLTFTE